MAKYGLIATWKMALKGVELGKQVLEKNGSLAQAIEQTITDIEDNPLFDSVGNGGLPNRLGEVELDAAYMDGDSLSVGGIMAVQNVKNPIKVAIHLSKLNRSCILAGQGAMQYAQINGFEFSNMLSSAAQDKYLKALAEQASTLNHDTVGVVGMLDGHMAAGISTSGLFMKHQGRIGDSPLIGSGFYADSEVGGATCTGVGEDIMKGVLAYNVVMRMKMLNEDVQTACNNAMLEHIKRFDRCGYEHSSMSLIAMDNAGNFGAATNKIVFPFVVTRDDMQVELMVAYNDEQGMRVMKATEEWISTYRGD
jgi:L-asparaginase / beta-aspartyl-peptidase